MRSRAVQVVVVESPAKARTVGAYLGRGYRVLACYGLVSDLPAKPGSVRPDEGFAMVYETAGRRAARALGIIRAALVEAEGLVLATDPDREGEAIAWQLLSWLRERDALGDRPVRRVAFHEITREAVREAMARPRGIDMDLVRAQQARRALDYLVGFGLSPVLWRKVPGCRSAGRVQSVALRLVCEREAEIEAFAPRAYWTVEAQAEVAAGSGAALPARPVRLDEAPLDGSRFETRAGAEAAVRRIREAGFTVASAMAWSTMGQWTDDEVGVDRADCAGAIPSCRARRRIGSEHDARSHGDVPFRRRPDRDPRVRQLLATFPPCTGRPQSQDRNAGIASGEIRPVLQTGKGSAGTPESHA